MATDPSNWPERRLAFTVEYDGTDYKGWQAQPDRADTIEQTLGEVMAAVVGHPVVIQAASRTDAGVHARDQWAATTIRLPITPEGLVKAVNRRLPAAIAIRDVAEAPPGFNPRLGNVGKTYCYRLYVDETRRPNIDRYAWHTRWPVDVARLRAAMAPCLGTHDFRSFAAVNGGHRTSVRTLERLECVERDGVLEIWIAGSAFLKQMVRNLVGTFVEVARGRWPLESIPAILEARDRSAAGRTAPARGLTLERMHRLPDFAYRPRR